MNDAGTGLGFAAFLGAIVLAFVVLVVGGYQLGWWLEEDAVNRRAVISDNSVNRESALRAEANQLSDEILDIDVLVETTGESPTLTAQRENLVDRFCDSYSQVGNIEFPASVEELYRKEC